MRALTAQAATVNLTNLSISSCNFVHYQTETPTRDRTEHVSIDSCFDGSQFLSIFVQYLCRRKPGHLQSRCSSSYSGKDELALEQDAERKIGWLLKLFFAGTATFVGYQFFPYMGDNLIQQSVSLLHVKDPLFKRMGASRLSRFAIDDERRMKIVEMGGAQELVNMLSTAKDDRTRKEALKALAALSNSVEAAGVLHQAGLISVMRSISDSVEDAEAQKYRSGLLKRFQDLRYDDSS